VQAVHDGAHDARSRVGGTLSTRDLTRRPSPSAPVDAASQVEPRSAHAVIIGINRYADSRIPDLRYARADAESFHDVLTDSEFGQFPQDNVRVLVDEHATRKNIIAEIGVALPKRVSSNDLVCLFFAGHGAPEPSSDTKSSDRTEKYLLPHDAIVDELRATAIPMEEVRKWLSWIDARQIVFFIDCCYSGRAGGRTLELPGIRAGLSDEFLSALGGEARFVVTACGPNEVAIEDPEIRHGLFTHYLIEGLEGEADGDSDGYVGADELVRYVNDQVERHARRLLGQMKPVQSGQVQGRVLLSKVRTGSPALGRSAEPLNADALDPSTFDAAPNAIHCVVVRRESSVGESAIPLDEHVRRALDYYGTEIARAVGRYRSTLRRSGSVAAANEPIPIVPSSLCVAEAFETEDSFTRAVQAMCRADAVVFDITGFEPGVMMLLGIRSVARRGVTICSLGGDYVLGSELSIPFNLQLLNLAAHSDAQEDRGIDPRMMLGSKLAHGFNEMAELPHYLDLPAFESVRRLGIDSAAYRPLEYDRQILVLCPFGEAYTRANWKTYLSKELSGKLRQHLRSKGLEQQADPQIVRLLDLQTPRLVAQTLYEAIRRTDLCIIDWTNLRANVLYEAGVRLACNRLGGVHIVEEMESGGLRLEGPASPGQPAIPRPPHADAMISLFKPVRYACRPGRTEPYERMITQFRAAIETRGDRFEGLVYRTVGTQFDRGSQPVAVSVIEELVRSANLLLSDDQESTGITPVMYHDVNKDILAEAEVAAAERRLAAWLYLERRYADARIRHDPELYAQIRTLAAQARRWLRTQQDPELDDYIRTRMVQIRETKEG
jgi:uncharacterized caspase-like protein